MVGFFNIIRTGQDIKPQDTGFPVFSAAVARGARRRQHEDRAGTRFQQRVGRRRQRRARREDVIHQQNLFPGNPLRMAHREGSGRIPVPLRPVQAGLPPAAFHPFERVGEWNAEILRRHGGEKPRLIVGTKKEG